MEGSAPCHLQAWEGGKVRHRWDRCRVGGPHPPSGLSLSPESPLWLDQQLLKGTIDSVQDVGCLSPRVQAMVLNTFAEFLQGVVKGSLAQVGRPGLRSANPCQRCHPTPECCVRLVSQNAWERWLAPQESIFMSLGSWLLEAALCDRGNVQPGGPSLAAVQLILRGRRFKLYLILTN